MNPASPSSRFTIAAKWWADQLRGGRPKLDNGDDSRTGDMVAVIAMMTQASRPRLDPETIDAFETVLAARIEHDGIGYISVDYDPDIVLSECARSVGLTLGMTDLPWRTSMWIDVDRVTVRCGYGAQVETLFIAPRFIPLGPVIAVTTGRLVCTRDDLADLLSYLTGEFLFNHALPRAADFARSHLLALRPDLSEEALADDLAALDDVLLNVENYDERIAICNSWLTALADRLGYNLVTLSPLDGWDSMDPAAEMVAMKSEAH